MALLFLHCFICIFSIPIFQWKIRNRCAFSALFHLHFFYPNFSMKNQECKEAFFDENHIKKFRILQCLANKNISKLILRIQYKSQTAIFCHINFCQSRRNASCAVWVTSLKQPFWTSLIKTKACRISGISKMPKDFFCTLPIFLQSFLVISGYFWFDNIHDFSG